MGCYYDCCCHEHYFIIKVIMTDWRNRPENEWRKEMIRHLEFEIEMLQNGPRGSVEAMGIGSLKKRWESIYDKG